MPRKSPEIEFKLPTMALRLMVELFEELEPYKSALHRHRPQHSCELTTLAPFILLWINDVGHRSYYCGSTMPATVHIIAHGHVYRAGHSRAGTPSDRLCILVIMTNSGTLVIITNSGILVIITNMPRSKRPPRRELPDDTRNAASARARTCPRTCLHTCLCAWLRVVLVEVADNDVVVDVGLRGDSIP